MTRVNPENVRAKLAALGNQVDARAVTQALKELGKDGAVDGADKALLDSFVPNMTAEAKARYGAFVSGPEAARVPLASVPGLAEVASGAKVLARGAQGPEVKKVQEALLRLNYGNWAPTETFGPITENAVKEFQVHVNQRLAGTTGPQAARQLPVDGRVTKETLAALDADLAAAPVGAKLGNRTDQMDVIIDLKRNRAYINAALVDKTKLDSLVQALGAEAKTAASKPVFESLKNKVAPGGQALDDYETMPLASEADLGLQDSDNQTRVFVSFPVGTGAIENGAPLTPTGDFVVMEKLKDREATKYNVPEGFNLNPANPFGPRWMRLYRVTANGTPSLTGYGLHGTTSNATWMNKGDGQRSVSHGCVRFRNEDILRVFQYVPNGSKVRIIGGLPDGAPGASIRNA